jgi:GntR family transcriptional regulator
MDKLISVFEAPPSEHQADGHPPPLHRQIADDLRRQILDGSLRPGDLVPSEHELMRRFGVSRGTVRQALAALRANGTVGGSQGRQLAVRTAPLTQSLSELISFSAWVQSLGKQPSGKVIKFGRQPAGEQAAEALHLRPDDPVCALIRVRLADGQPLMVERTAFPLRVGTLLEGIDLNCQSIYAELARHGVVFASARHLISAIPASHEDANLLEIPADTPLVRVHRQACSPTREPLEWSDDRYVDQVSFAIENTSTGSGLVRRLAPASRQQASASRHQA